MEIFYTFDFLSIINLSDNVVMFLVNVLVNSIKQKMVA